MGLQTLHGSAREEKEEEFGKMKEKMRFWTVLTLLLAIVVVSAVSIEPARASGTIYARADGSIDPPTALIHRFGG
jgi:hypothetical protein